MTLIGLLLIFLVTFTHEIRSENAICDPIKSPCLNGGECRFLNNDAVCICPVQYSGKNCEFKISQCPSVCINGMCAENQGVYGCKCISGWTGTNCNQSTVPGCQNVNCNNGLCVPKIIGFTCLCLNGWEGPFCTNKTESKCNPECQNDGLCEAGVCHCKPYYIGNYCEKIDYSLAPKCSSNVCSNGGTCYRIQSKIFCSCKGGFSGTYCKNIDFK